MRKNLGQIEPLGVGLFLIFFSFLFFIFIFVIKSPLIVFTLICGVLIGLITLVNVDLALIILIFSMMLSPEIPLGNLSERAVVVRVDDLLLLTMFFFWLAKIAINKEMGLLRKTPLNSLIITYIIVYAISTIWGIVGKKVSLFSGIFYLLKYIEYYMIYFMTANSVHTHKQAKRLIIAMLVVCFITCVYANFTLAKYGRATAPFERGGEANTLGGYLVLMFALVLGSLIHKGVSRNKFFLGILAALIVFTLLNTLSRGSFLGFIMMFLVFIIFSKKKKLFLMGVLLISLVAVPLILPQKVIMRIQSTFIPGRGYERGQTQLPIDDSAAARLIGFQRVFEMWKKQPLLGYGATGVGFTDMHYALVLGEAGIVGFFLFIWTIFTIFKLGFKMLKQLTADWGKGLVVGYLAGLAGLLTHSISANTFIIIRIMEPFWLLTAVVMMLPRFSEAPGPGLSGIVISGENE